MTFVDSAAFDSVSPEEVYTGSKHFTLDYSKPPGQGWTYKAFTMDRFDYPDDPSLHLTRNVRGSPMLRRINGKLYLYTLDMYAHYLTIYRFEPSSEGGIAIPSGLLAQNPVPTGWPAGQPTYGEWMWRDLNGNGRVDADEITSNPSTGSTVGNGFYWVDTPGNVWQATPGSVIREMPLQGFDAVGNPIYQYAGSLIFAMPQPFTRITRIVYIAETDTMYISGFTAGIPWDNSHWKEPSPVLARYDNWSSGSPSMQYAISLPWNTQSSPQVTTVGVAVAGNYIFVAELYTLKVDVCDVRTGQPVGYMTPGADVGKTSGWVDTDPGISAVKRANGGYVVALEDDARAKILLYRWTP